jgi:chromosome segregation ATPase
VQSESEQKERAALVKRNAELEVQAKERDSLSQQISQLSVELTTAAKEREEARLEARKQEERAAHAEGSLTEAQSALERARRDWEVERKVSAHELEQELRAQSRAAEDQLQAERERAASAWQEYHQANAAELQHLRADREAIVRETQQLQARLIEADKERETLRAASAAQSQQRDAEQVATYKARVTELETELSELTANFVAVCAERDASAQDQGDLGEKLATLQAEAASAQQREKEYQAELSRVRQALNQTRQQRDLAAQVQTELQEQVDTLRRELDTSLEKSAPAAPPVGSDSAIRAQLAAVITERDEWRKRMLAAERAFDEERQSLHFQVDRLQKQLTTMRQVLNGLGIHT